MHFGLRGGVKLLSLGTLTLLLASTASAQQPPDTPRLKPSTERKLILPEMPYNYAKISLPAHFNTPEARRFDNTPNNNRITDDGATLGRVLFYDTRMSANNTVACASCHVQKNSFVDPDRFSKGFEGKKTDRHAPSLVNLRYYPRGRFFWDERASSLEDQVLKPIQSKVEMGHELPKLMEILAQDEQYPILFKKAFGDSKITPERVSKAVAQFLRSLVSYNSKFDQGMAKADSIRDEFANFNAKENQGKNLFAQRCANCHLPGGQQAHFFMNRPLNNGLDADIKKSDGGVGDITLRTNQIGLFKSPSLRNVEFTGPYMHDGRFDTLEKVIEHYSTGVKNHPNRDGRARPFNFNTNQKAALVAFLKTLSDNQFLTDPRFSDPFQ
jgi:cytochrome c peroxidase